MKKLIIVVAALLLVLAGCSSQDPVQQTSSNNVVDISSSVIKGSVDGSSYKIGSDIDAGEYYIVAKQETDPEFRDPSGLNISIVYLSDIPVLEIGEDGEGINAMLPVTNTAYLTISEADGYLFLANADAYPVDAKPAITINSDGSYDPGVYKVGVDIPAGTYTLEAIPESFETGYVITSDSIFSMDFTTAPTNIISSGEVLNGAPQSVTVFDGQYLNAGTCKIIPE